MKTYTILIGLLLIANISFSQTSSIYGKVTNEETGEELIYANLVLSKNGVFLTGASTDFEGNYSITIDTGTYEVKVTYTGYTDKIITGILVRQGQGVKLDIQLLEGVTANVVEVVDYKVPLIDKDNTSTESTITSSEIRNKPTKNITALAATPAGLSQVDEGDAVTIKGSRPDVTDYYIDGIRISGNLIPQSEIEIDQLEVITEPVVPHNSEESYESVQENDFVSARKNKFSTFSIDVDYASYSNIRRFINHGQTPPRDAVRIEEMINYFNYDYPFPQDNTPFSINTELSECPWNRGHKLLHIGLKGEAFKMEKATSNNLVFLIDVSGSMGSPNKLPLLKKSFKLLVNELQADDRIAIVVYAGAAGLVLPSTPVKEKNKILDAIDQLSSGGSTAGGAGIKLAYKIAIENKKPDANNRVILATDGDFNVGISSKEDLHKLIETKRQSGVYLTVLGFGMGNYKDDRLETLADKGNGHYAYIDNIKEAEKVFIKELNSTLYTIAKDVKIQLVFNSRNVKSYRLIGYENRRLAKKDFADDTKDAGELGAEHTVTAIYELELKTRNPKAKLTDVRLRYKRPNETKSRLINKWVRNQTVPFPESSDNFRFSAAVAAFGMLLKDSKYKGDADCKMVINIAENALGKDPHAYRQEFIDLVEEYESMTLTSSK